MSTININTSYTLTQAIVNTLTFPITINRLSPTATLIVSEDLILTSANSYFIIGSSDITIEGNNHTITISNTSNYPGLVQNGTGSISGQSNATIQNLIVSISGFTTLLAYDGWIAQQYFANGAANNQIINCSSTATIPQGGGGIVGQYAGANGGDLTINKCYSLGSIDINSGGIAGQNAGSAGTIEITNCYSFGAILGTSAGGIVGYSAGSSGGSVTVSNCYSRGVISGQFGGGIIGYYASNTTVSNCYSIGDLTGIGVGGIAGYQGPSGLFVTRSYSSGLLSGSSAGGIIAYSGSDSSAYSSNCYSEANHGNGGYWTSVNANTVLSPSSAWVVIGTNQPYYLAAFNQQLYSPNNYARSTATSYTSPSGNFQTAGYQYTILSISTTSGSATTGITADINTGAIAFPSTLTPDTYTINLITQIPSGSTGYGYNFNSFVFTQLTIPVAAICFAAGSMVATDRGEVAIEEIRPNEDTIGGLPVVAITASVHPENWVVKFEPGCLGAGVPNRPTVASRDHIVYLDHRTPISAGELVGKRPGVRKIAYDGKPLYNVLLEQHGRMLVNGIQAETLHPRNPIACIYRMRLDASKKSEWLQIMSDAAIQMPEIVFTM